MTLLLAAVALGSRQVVTQSRDLLLRALDPLISLVPTARLPREHYDRFENCKDTIFWIDDVSWRSCQAPPLNEDNQFKW